MTTCSDCELLISAELDDELTAEERNMLLSHLEYCPTCRALRQDLRAIFVQTHSLQVQPPPDLTAHLMLPPRHKKPWRTLCALAAMLCLCIIGLAHFLPPPKQADYALRSTEFATENFAPQTARNPIRAYSMVFDLYKNSDPLLPTEAAEKVAAFCGVNVDDLTFLGLTPKRDAYLFSLCHETDHSSYFTVSNGVVTPLSTAPKVAVAMK
ncbi:MAG: anti-sigma factor [Evtepia sp.]